MSKEDFTIGSSKVEDFWKFINERHEIYLKRKEGLPRPWTDDPIFLDWKFINVFRELDRGTIALRQVLKQLYTQYKEYMASGVFAHYIGSTRTRAGYECEIKESYIRNQFITYILYRMFGHYENCVFGPITNTTAFYYFLRGQRETGKQIFTDAYMQPSVKGEDKLITFERVCREIVSSADYLINEIKGCHTLEHAWELLQTYDCIGPFTAYEFVCDLRYTDILRNTTDTCTWCSIGQGAERGLKRMGLTSSLKSIQKLFFESRDFVSGVEMDHWIYKHWIYNEGWFKRLDEYALPVYPYWELREIEHCLCEFDKYERIRLGQGSHMAKYNGRPSETSQ